ncbi:lactate/malate family dehydrogenase [Streptomyces violascens]|uniref:lactate/malate family dehydrogenase n=1 Tax=Streptomyces violascens TaxID=67381 RepID=UPI001674B97A|nr:lactate dehydrogenase [Streptomyces violascens]GGU49904.1 L-lactate dehydrogenase 2 [Streptomyces violascens]
MTGLTVGIVGAGAVGQTVAALLVGEPWCDRLLITSRTDESAAGLVTDLDDMAHLSHTATRVHALPVAELDQADAVVICPRARFTNTATRNVRMAGLAANAPLIAELARTFRGFTPPVVMVTNPVDVLARLFATISGAPTYGIGSATDTVRYRAVLAAHHQVPVTAVDGYVIGEHGDGAVICASSTTVHGQTCTVPLDLVRAELAARPRQINTGIGRTRHGPAAAVLSTLRKLLDVEDGTDVLSVNRAGVWLGIRLHIHAGHPTVQPLELNAHETAALLAARTALEAAYRQISHHEQGARTCL